MYLIHLCTPLKYILLFIKKIQCLNKLLKNVFIKKLMRGCQRRVVTAFVTCLTLSPPAPAAAPISVTFRAPSPSPLVLSDMPTCRNT